MPELPSGTVTFLFTDIEGSTRLLKALGDRYGEALAEHQAIVRQAVAEAGATRSTRKAMRSSSPFGARRTRSQPP
jgi:class 3 adenylate cyclase